MTPKAQAALADYLAMGPGRSLEGLCEQYRQRVRTENEASVPTTRLATLGQWSAEYNWQEEVQAYQARMAKAMETDAQKANRENLGIVRAAKARYAEAIRNGTFKADDSAGLERVVKLEAQLLGEPLADRHEVTGKDGEPIQHEHLPSGQLGDMLTKLGQHIGSLATSSEDQPAEPGGSSD